MSRMKTWGLFCSINDLNTKKPESWQFFLRDEAGLPWGVETAHECPDCGKGCKATDGRWHCFYCGKSGKLEGAQVAHLTDEQIQAEKKLRREQGEAKREHVLRIWSEQCVPIGTKNVLVNSYFSARCLSLGMLPNIDEVMRWHPALTFGKDKLPCIVSLFRDAKSDRPMAIHRTHITNAREGKSEKRAWGPYFGCAIKLWPLAKGGKVLTLGEGIENVMSAVELEVGSPPAWAATVAGNLSRIPVIRDVEKLLIAADNDEHQKGQEHADVLREKWRDKGREVDAKVPEDDEDFNALLVRIRRGQP